MLSLRELQLNFFHSIASIPGGGSANFSPGLVQVVEGRDKLGPEERLNIYAQMYYARLIEVLREDFSRVAAVLGCERFDRLVRAYLTHHPSTHPSLRYLGRHFAAFLAAWPEAVSLSFLSDLARLEWARLEVFDAPDVEPLRVEHLHGFSPDEWPSLKFQLIPAFHALQSAWPVHEIWAAATDETSADRSCERREKTAVRIWREGFAVYHSKMDATEQAALTAVQAGEPFAGICATLASLVPTEEAAPMMGSLLLRWLEDGILVNHKA